jgi:hypothetical protein
MALDGFDFKPSLIFLKQYTIRQGLFTDKLNKTYLIKKKSQISYFNISGFFTNFFHYKEI